MKILILAKSNKRKKNNEYGKCVAGLTPDGGWVRLVSDVYGDSLSDLECEPFECLDIIEVDITECPLDNQPENMKLERLVSKIGSRTIDKVVDRFGVCVDEYCFVNNKNSLNKQEMNLINDSLKLFKITNLSIYRDSNKKWKTAFEYNGARYIDISMTDPKFYVESSHNDAYIVLSLPSDTGAYPRFYKFVAAIYPIKG